MRLGRAARVAVLGAALVSCGGAALDSQIGVTPRPPVTIADWPPLTRAQADALTVAAALTSGDGQHIRVAAYLVALSPPCAACNVVGQRRDVVKDADRIGKTAQPRGPDMPGCAPCPPAAATFGDEPAKSSRALKSAPLRAVASAEGLQARHVGHMFLLTGTFHTKGELGPELEVSDVGALEGL